MNSPRKTLHAAMIAALGISLAPAASFGVSYDINRSTVVAGAPTGSILPDSTGDSVLYPFYTTVEGASTTFNLTNTSPEETIVAKIRFRDQVYSRDALDFLVVLSPEDKFGFWVADNNGVPTAYWYDNSCVIGPDTNNTPNVLKSLPFVDPTVVERAPPYADSAVGHVEVIGMLNLRNVSYSGNDLAVNAAHNVQGVPVNCNVLVRAFRDRDAVNSFTQQANGAVLSEDEDALEEADVGNWLTGSMLVTADGKSIEAGTDAIMVRNTFTRGFLAAQSSEECVPVVPGNLGTFNNVNQGSDTCFSFYNEDNLASAAWDTVEDAHPNLADINWVGPLFDTPANTGTNTVAVLDELLAAQFALSGEWSNNATNGVGFDWVNTFPTKYVYMSETGAIGNVGNKLAGVGLLPFNTTPAPFPASGCVGGDPAQLNWSIFGVEEDPTETEGPGENPLAELCNAVTIVTIKSANQSVSDIEPSLIQTAANRGVVSYDASLDPAVRGWLELPLVWDATAPTHTANTLDGAGVSSLLWLIRSIDADGLLNNGSLRGNNHVNDIVVPTPPPVGP